MTTMCYSSILESILDPEVITRISTQPKNEI